jgi:hypothetical protein
VTAALLARMTGVVRRRFGMEYTLAGMDLKRSLANPAKRNLAELTGW